MGQQVGRFEGHQQRVNSVAISPDGLHVLSGSDDRTVRLWEVATRREIDRRTHDRPVTAVAFSPEAQPRLVGERRQDRAALGPGHPARRSHPPFRWACPRRLRGHFGRGDRALSGGSDGALTLWELDGQGPGRRLEGPRGDWVRCVAFLPDGDHALSGTQNGRLILWDVDEGRVVHRFEGGADHRGVAVLPDGRHALTADTDGFVRFWRLPETGRSRKAPRGPAGRRAP